MDSNNRVFSTDMVINSEEYRLDIWHKFQERFIAMLQSHSQVLVVRLLVRFPEEIVVQADNRCFQHWMETYRRDLDRNRLTPHYLWVREQHRSLNAHYHVILFFDGNAMRYFRKERAEELWDQALQSQEAYTGSKSGLIEVCPASYRGVPMNQGICVSRSDGALQNYVGELGLYLAKTFTKGSAPCRIREFGCSLL